MWINVVVEKDVDTYICRIIYFILMVAIHSRSEECVETFQW